MLSKVEISSDTYRNTTYNISKDPRAKKQKH